MHALPAVEDEEADYNTGPVGGLHFVAPASTPDPNPYECRGQSDRRTCSSRRMSLSASRRSKMRAPSEDSRSKDLTTKMSSLCGRGTFQPCRMS